MFGRTWKVNNVETGSLPLVQENTIFGKSGLLKTVLALVYEDTIFSKSCLLETMARELPNTTKTVF